MNFGADVLAACLLEGPGTTKANRAPGAHAWLHAGGNVRNQKLLYPLLESSQSKRNAAQSLSLTRAKLGEDWACKGLEARSASDCMFALWETVPGKVRLP